MPSSSCPCPVDNWQGEPLYVADVLTGPSLLFTIPECPCQLCATFAGGVLVNLYYVNGDVLSLVPTCTSSSASGAPSSSSAVSPPPPPPPPTSSSSSSSSSGDCPCPPEGWQAEPFYPPGSLTSAAIETDPLTCPCPLCVTRDGGGVITGIYYTHPVTGVRTRIANCGSSSVSSRGSVPSGSSVAGAGCGNCEYVPTALLLTIDSALPLACEPVLGSYLLLYNDLTGKWEWTGEHPLAPGEEWLIEFYCLEGELGYMLVGYRVTANLGCGGVGALADNCDVFHWQATNYHVVTCCTNVEYTFTVEALLI